MTTSDSHQPGTQRRYEADGMEYYIYYPPGIPPSGGWPILLFLHGIGEATNTYSDKTGWRTQGLDAVKSHDSPPQLCESRAQHAGRLLSSFIVVSPQFPFTPTEDQRKAGRRPWRWMDRADTVLSILEVVVARYLGNRRRVFATGFSRGGAGVLAIAAAKREPSFAKIVVVDSESDPVAPTNVPMWVHYAGAHTISRAVEAHTGVSKGLAAGGWTNVPPGEERVGGTLVFTNWNLDLSTPTANHTETCRRAYADGRVYDWLLEEQSR